MMINKLCVPLFIFVYFSILVGLHFFSSHEKPLKTDFLVSKQTQTLNSVTLALEIEARYCAVNLTVCLFYLSLCACSTLRYCSTMFFPTYLEHIFLINKRNTLNGPCRLFKACLMSPSAVNMIESSPSGT
jgi:hypothetical protein